MIHLSNVQLEIEIGAFHNVEGLEVGEGVVSILSNSTEIMIPIQTCYDPASKEWKPIEVEGEFGSFRNVQAGSTVPGLILNRVTRVSVEKLDGEPDWDFHRRLLKIYLASGLTMVWTLYCEGAET